jgi:opacity protein-like surface antigen
MRRFVAFLLVVAALVLTPALQASAEMYIAGQVGYAMPSDLSDIKGTGSRSGITSSDLALKSGLAYGMKIGGYFPGAANWLGLEFEGFYNQPDIKAQTATRIPGGPQQVDASRMRVAHFAVNLLARYPGETFQPYVGVGGGVNAADIAQTPTTFGGDFTMAPSLNVLAGMRVFVTERIAFFGEFKHNRSTFKFSDDEFDAKYRTTMFMGGVSFHFK